MRKIYSLVLMAAALLLGTNVNATIHPVSNQEGLTNAFNTASSGDTIRLTGNLPQTEAIVIGGNLYKSLTLDMNNFNIDMSLATPETKLAKPWNFEITHGKLVIIGKGAIRNNIHGDANYSHNAKEIIVARLYGSTTQTDSAYSVLEVGKDVQMLCTDSGKVAINVDQVGSTHSSFGTIVKFDGKCYGKKYGIQLSGNVNRIPRNDGSDSKEVLPGKVFFPYFHIQSNAEVIANPTDKKATGVYAAGYGEWLIEGYVHGSTGVYIKSGDIDINGAHIQSDNNNDTGVNSGCGSGIDAGGNAIATETNSSYGGHISVEISGTSTVTAGENGYAYQDINTAQGKPSQVDSVVISGGTFTGGAQGCVTIDASEGDDIQVELAGGTFTGDIETLIDNVDKDQIISDIVAVDGEGNATVVIGKVDPTDDVVKPVKNVVPTVLVLDSATANSVIKLDADTAGQALDLVLGDSIPAKTDFVAKYLSLNGSATKTAKVTIPAGKKLTVDQVVMNAYGQIVVEAGAQLIITGTNGIFANEESNLILHANAANQALFVIAPTVTGNKQPKAKVEYYTEAYGVPTTGTSTNYKWDRLSSPLSTYTSITNNYASLIPQPALLPGEDHLTTWVEQFNEATQEWEGIYYSQMKPFVDYAWSNNAASGGITYTFAGNLQGNVADNITLEHAGWNYMGNAFIAPIYVKKMLEAIEASGASIDNSIYLWDMNQQSYKPVNKTFYNYFSVAGAKEIPAMQTFIVKLISGNSAVLDINYASSVYEYAKNPGSFNAPERIISTDINAFRMTIMSADGEEDDVYMVESDDFTASYDNGADIVKYMNTGLNIYAEDEDMYAMVASDNILGTVFSLQTTEAINYTLTFAEVRGEEYALRDKMTGRVMNIAEGAAYNFSAQPNETIEGRFEIVGRQEMPTAVETVEEMVNTPKAIYTIMGQYVGETTDWNNLPAGVYVVDGVKIVK